MGNSAGLWVSVPYYSFAGGGLILKTFTDGAGASGAYVVSLSYKGVDSDDHDLELYIMTHDMVAGVGSAHSYAGTIGQLPDHATAYKTIAAATYEASAWYHIEATITAQGATNVIDVTLTTGSVGNETFVGTYQYIDDGPEAVNSRDTGDLGVFTWPWITGVDVDNLSYVPEPATLGLFGLGGLAMLRRKRGAQQQHRRDEQSGNIPTQEKEGVR